MAAFETVLAKNPRHETALLGAAVASQSLNQLEPAISNWRRVVEVNPWNVSYRMNLAQLLAYKKDWSAALPHSEAWLRLDPASVDARALRVTCLLKTGDKAGARAEFARLERMQPPNLNELRAKFEVESRQP
jgi:tetratricopeptide (TPR) repeat protein